MSFEADLMAAAEEELDRACSLRWRELVKITPWGDTYEGLTPGGRDVCFERAYLWEGEPGGDIRIEVMVYQPDLYEAGVKLTRLAQPDPLPE
jgi:hypothetical protein